MAEKFKRSTPVSILGLILWIGICFLVAWAGAQASPGIASSEWYDALSKPSWNPPNWVFGPVWTVLYAMMGTAVWIVWKKYGFSNAGPALISFFIQLVLNGFWSQLFFRYQNPGWAFIEIFFLLAAILVTTFLFKKKDNNAAWLMIPYLLWVIFAACLNGTIWWLNS